MEAKDSTDLQAYQNNSVWFFLQDYKNSMRAYIDQIARVAAEFSNYK